MYYEQAIQLAERFPHTFTIQYPPERALFRQHFSTSLPPLDVLRTQILCEPRMLLYVHVPFCAAKCFYCNFAVDLGKDESRKQRYVDALCGQLARVASLFDPHVSIPGIDIGGGTPTLLSAAQLTQLLAALQPFLRRAEVPHALSIETTPRVAATEPEKLAVLRSGGVDRVSVGIQSSNDETLAQVNRRAQRSLGERAVAGLLDAGFRRVNVDLVFALPGQTRAQFREDLRQVVALRPDSITTYDCLYRGQGRALPQLSAERPDAAAYGALYDMAYELLTGCGYVAPYGSVNFSRHAAETGTSPYFEGRLLDGLPYLGTGNYASSMLGPWWWFGPAEVEDYVARMDAGDVLPASDSYELPLAERVAKALLLSLNFGVLDPARFVRQFQTPIESVVGPQLDLALRSGWLERRDGVYGVRAGRFHALPQIRALFYSAAAVAWVAERGSLVPAPRLRVR